MMSDMQAYKAQSALRAAVQPSHKARRHAHPTQHATTGTNLHSHRAGIRLDCCPVDAQQMCPVYTLKSQQKRMSGRLAPVTPMFMSGRQGIKPWGRSCRHNIKVVQQLSKTDGCLLLGCFTLLH
jgi:hypothetical protein